MEVGVKLGVESVLLSLSLQTYIIPAEEPVLRLVHRGQRISAIRIPKRSRTMMRRLRLKHAIDSLGPGLHRVS